MFSIDLTKNCFLKVLIKMNPKFLTCQAKWNWNWTLNCTVNLLKCTKKKDSKKCWGENSKIPFATLFKNTCKWLKRMTWYRVMVSVCIFSILFIVMHLYLHSYDDVIVVIFDDFWTVKRILHCISLFEERKKF